MPGELARERLAIGNPVEEATGTLSWIRLYEAPWQKDLAFEFAPEVDYAKRLGSGYIRRMMPVNLKSLDINLPRSGFGNMDVMRKIEIWGVFGNDVIASTESDFYNSYTEPDWALRANSAKYRLIGRVEPGQRLRVNPVEPVKRVMVVGVL
jgi:hypothetical protein